MNKSNATHTFHGGDVPILRSAIEGDRIDYRAMLSRERVIKYGPFQARPTPAEIVRDELDFKRPHRVLIEGHCGRLA